MKAILAMLGGVVLLGAGCAVEPAGYYSGGASLSISGEYPDAYYVHRGYVPGGYYHRGYYRHYRAPYDRDRYLYRY
jgi:hypothetical protein